MSKRKQQVLVFILVIIVAITVGVKMNQDNKSQMTNSAVTPSTPSSLPSQDYSTFKADLKKYADENFGGKLYGEDTKTSWYDSIKFYDISETNGEIVVTVTTALKTTMEKAEGIRGMVFGYINSKTDGRKKQQYANRVIIKMSNDEILENKQNSITFENWKSWK